MTECEVQCETQCEVQRVPLSYQIILARAQKYGKRVKNDPEKYQNYLKKRRINAKGKRVKRGYVTDEIQEGIYQELRSVIKWHTSGKFVMVKNLKNDISTDKPLGIHADIPTLRTFTPAMLQYWILRYFHDQGFEKRSKSGS